VSPQRLKRALVPVAEALPAFVREPLRALWRAVFGADVVVKAPHGYADRMAQERANFDNREQVHDLPPIYHYWSNRYLLPMEEQFGARHPEDFIARYLHASAMRTGAARPRFASLGSGNCDAEVRIAADLVRRGLDDFTIECIDINPAMLERGRELAAAQGQGARIVPVLADFNEWRPAGRYDGIMANQSLHHVVALEHLFDVVRDALAKDAWFVVSDLIGRNGHMRWPEAQAIVEEFWRQLPATHRYNHQLQRQEDEFANWDCSTEGFEGIRAQDILPLLMERFGFEVFLPFANLVDPFIDRGIGHNFDPADPQDTAFIDRVHARDEAEIRSGRIKPTHLMAVLTADRSVRGACRGGLTPEHCVRRP
jgi:SAM-dependent methyltransferase